MAFEGADCSPNKKTGITFRGREIILSKTRGRPMHGIQKKAGWYDDAKRIEVVTLFACLGDPDKVGELATVPAATIRSWSKTPWFKELLAEIKSENNEKIEAKFSQIVDRVQDLVIDRLENGDFVLTRHGEMVRKPINAKELAIVGAVTFDKRQISRNKP